MKNGWEIKKLSEVCSVIAGQSPEGKYYNTNFEGLPFYQGKKEFKDKHIGEPTKWTTKVTKEAIAGDILMSVRAPVGPVNFATQKICIGRGLAAIRATESIENDYLFYYFIKHENEIVGNEGAVFNSINKTQIENLNVPIPPIPEQKRIVKILDEAFAAIDKAKANAEKNLQNSRKLFDSYLNKVFTNPGEDWEEKRLGDLAKINYGYTEKASFEEIGPKFLRITDIQNNYVNWTSVPFCKIEKSQLPKYILTNGDIVFARTGATTGKSYLIKNPPDSVFASYLIRLQIQTKELMPEFVHLFFQTQRYWDNIKIGVSGSAQGGFNATKLSKLTIIFPAILEQNRIVRKFERLILETNKLETIYQQKLSDLEELKKSILQKAFEGQLARKN